MYTIQDLADGKCAVKNDGTLEELRKVLNLAFPTDGNSVNGFFLYYFQHYLYKGDWTFSDRTDLPIQSVRDFEVRPATPQEIQQAQCPYYDGQLVAVTDNKITWELVYASGKVDKEGNPIFYTKGTKGNGSVNIWKYHKPLPEGFTLD